MPLFYVRHDIDTLILAFFENFAGQGSDIDAIFEIEALVVDDVINDRTRSSVDGGHASKPHSPSPSRRGNSPPPPFRSPHTPTRSLSPSSPPIKIPLPMTSPGQMSTFPSSDASTPDDTPDIHVGPTPVRAGRDPNDERPPRTEPGQGAGPGSLEVFRSDSSDSTGRQLPTITRSPPPRPQLPPRHVRTRRDSHAVQSFRAAALAGMQPSNGGAQNNAGAQNQNGGGSSVQWQNSDPFSLNPPMNSAPMPDIIAPSPLGQLYGTVVMDEDQVNGGGGGGGMGQGLGVPQARRMRTMSAGAALLEPGNPFGHRRVSSSGSTRPMMWGHSREHLPETVQEAEDDAEDEPEEKNHQSSELMKMMKEMQEQQLKLEKQLKEIMSALSGGSR